MTEIIIAMFCGMLVSFYIGLTTNLSKFSFLSEEIQDFNNK